MSIYTACPHCVKVVQLNPISDGTFRCGTCGEKVMNEAQPERLSGGTKLDENKNRLDLLSAPWIEGVGHVLTFGAKKYEAHNWRKGIQTSRLLGAALRHLFAYLRGEDLDPETGLSHLLHASCCVMFAFELSLTKPELDDRYKVISHE
jgi:hypothetical protein